MGKSLRINCAICDARTVRESVLDAYERISINSALLLAGPEARELLSRHQVKLNAANILDLEGDVQVSTVNGSMELHPGQSLPAGRVYLMVNGNLVIAPGSEELVGRYLGIRVNGTVICPESMAVLLSAANINGSLSTYPDGCVLLKRTVELDRTFCLRTKQDARYYAARRIVALAPDIDFGRLAEKNVRFVTRQLMVAESLAEAAVPLFDERADILILPDGCAFVNGSATLDEALLRRYGGKLYVNGSLAVTRASASCLERVSYLRVGGDLLVTKGMEAAVMECAPIYGRLLVLGGVHLCDRDGVVIDRPLLESAEDGLSVKDCGRVEFSEDVPPELIRERLVALRDCGDIICTEVQRAAVQMTAEDVGRIGPACPEEEDGEDVTSINAATYQF